MLNHFPRLTASTLLGLTVLLAPAFPTVLKQMTVEQMTAASTEIVQGVVTGSHTALTGSTIFTHYTVTVSQRWKGPNNPTTDVALPGGILNGIRQSVPGVPTLATGQQYMLFLWQGSTGPNQPVGFSQGVYLVTTSQGDGITAWRPAVGEMMVGTGGKPVIDRGVRLPLTALRSRVSLALAKGQVR